MSDNDIRLMKEPLPCGVKIERWHTIPIANAVMFAEMTDRQMDMVDKLNHCELCRIDTEEDRKFVIEYLRVNGFIKEKNNEAV